MVTKLGQLNSEMNITHITLNEHGTRNSSVIMPNQLMSRTLLLTGTEKPTTSKADPPDRGPHRTLQERQRQFPCDIGPQYGIISTVKIPAVSSNATSTLSLRNFLRTCKTQVQSTFATVTIARSCTILELFDVE